MGTAGETLKGGKDPNKYDVFLSHSGKDKPIVRELANRLTAAADLRCWLDENELRPGLPWQELLEQGIRDCKSVAVMIGKDGISPWENEEMRAALQLAVQNKVPVIPVLLPGAPKKPDLPLFLSGRTWVDLRPAITENNLQRLIWGVTGQPPGIREPIPKLPGRPSHFGVAMILIAVLVGGLVFFLFLSQSETPRETSSETNPRTVPSTAKKPEKLRPLQLGNVSDTLNNTYIIKFYPPKKFHIASLLNPDEKPVQVSLSGFPESSFYTALGHELSEIKSKKVDFRIVMMPGKLERSEYPFDIIDTEGNVLHVNLHVQGDGLSYYQSEVEGFRNIIPPQGNAKEAYRAAQKATARAYRGLPPDERALMIGSFLIAVNQPEGAGYALWKAEKKLPRAVERMVAHAPLPVISALARTHEASGEYQGAAGWYETAAKLGDPDAQNSLGKLYAEGLGVAKDTKEANKLFESAAKLGHREAQRALNRSNPRPEADTKELDVDVPPNTRKLTRSVGFPEAMNYSARFDLVQVEPAWRTFENQIVVIRPQNSMTGQHEEPRYFSASFWGQNHYYAFFLLVEIPSARERGAADFSNAELFKSEPSEIFQLKPDEANN